MKKYFKLLFFAFGLIFIGSCDSETTFVDNPEKDGFTSPKNLSYSTLIVDETREFKDIISGLPSIDTNGFVPTFEIVSIKDKDGNILDSSYTNLVSIGNIGQDIKNVNFVKTVVDDPEQPKSTASVGKIVINTSDKFTPGKYTFSVKASVTYQGETLSTVFDDVFELIVGPALVSNLLYVPATQNLLTTSPTVGSTKPFIKAGSKDVSYSLGSDSNKLSINSETGVVSINSEYTFTQNDTITPKVIVTSNVSQESTEFQGESFLTLIVSSTPVALPKQTKYFFYPTLAALNKAAGIQEMNVLNLGSADAAQVWKRVNRSPLANAERPSFVTGNKTIETNSSLGSFDAHDSEVILETQDLTLYNEGYVNVATVFYTMNRFVEYMVDGRTPTDLEIYYSTDYSGDNNKTATWNQINDKVKCLINKTTGTPFVGTPYPGDQNLRGLPNPDDLKDGTKNADGKWVRNEYDLTPHLNEKYFTLKFVYKSYYMGSLKELGTASPTPRPGRYLISDVHFKATEQ